jgi:hypothetical protein
MRGLGGIVVAAWLAVSPAASVAQAIEVTPSVGYRFGGGFFERVTGQPVDLDGAPAAGGVINVRVADDVFVEALLTHQTARVTVPGGPLAPPMSWRITVDHWQGGALQEFGTHRRARPFASGLLGLTRYATEGDSEIRFTVGAGGGVKLMPIRHVGVRLDGRVFATFASVDGQVLACSPGLCLARLEADVVWQAEFSVGLVMAFQ